MNYERTGVINNFALIEEIDNYDKANNPLNLSVYELLPIGVKWDYRFSFDLETGKTGKLIISG
ncbi:MAG: hypothetical protein LBH21_03575 [Gracilibacteraceae bacterium]|nr:hypothetical protein [Gracilibacteraceae bacterium]